MKVKLTADGPLGKVGDVVEPESVLQGKLMCQDGKAREMPDVTAKKSKKT